MNELIKIMEKDGQLVVSSRQVAENFEKQHKDVLESICKLISQMSTAENSALFIKSDYIASNGKRNPEYLMTRDGFSLLVMGFTGNKALEWKLKYIEAFNHMEAELNSPERIMARALKIAEETTNRLRIDNSRLKVENQIMQPKAEYFDELVDRNLLTNFRETAAQLGVKQKKFITFLIDHKYIYRDKKGKLMPYAKKNNGLFELRETYHEKTEWSGTQTLITPKGRETFRLLIQ